MDEDIKKDIHARMAQLPKVVQDAINSADTEKHLRELSESYKLHLDQWQVLQNEVMLTLLAFQEPDDLAKNIKDEVGVSDEIATALAADISRIVFEPIREELERQLEHPNAQAKTETGVETMAAQALSDEQQADSEGVSAPPVVDPVAVTATVSAPTPAPLVPPPTAPETKVVRTPLSEVYKTGEASTERKDVHNDPYRETP
jgi:hypothetical protein